MGVDWRLRRMNNYGLDYIRSDADYLDIPVDPSGETSFTVIGFIEYKDLVGSGSLSQPFFKGYGGPGGDFEYALHTGQGSELRLYLRNNSTGNSINPRWGSAEPGEGYLLAGVKNGADAELWADAELKASGTHPDGAFGLESTAFNQGNSGGGDELAAISDRLAFYNRALTQSEQQEILDAGEFPTDGLLGFYEMNEGSGSTAADSSGNGNDGTLNGPDWVVDTNPFALDDRLLDARVRDAYNRFARDATAVLDDPDGDARAMYPTGYPVQLEVKRDIDANWSTRFGGFVFGDSTNRNTLELDILGHDLWLRRRKIFDSYSSTTISNILNDLITQYTPLTWVPGNVSVVNDVTYTRQWKGETLAEIIEELAAASANEEFGANNDAEFFFRPQSSNTSPRMFGVGEYYEADFEESATREVNKVVLYYGEGTSTGAVAVQDRESQRSLQDDLGAPRPVVIEKTANYPEIDSEETAENKARKILNGGTQIRTGKLRTWEAFDVYPGDVTRVIDPDQNVDGDYRVAELTYRWQEDETEVRLAENSAGVVDVLASQSDEVTRVDAKQADETAAVNEILDLSQNIEIETEIEIYTYTIPDDMFVFGVTKGGLGDTRAGGGLLGDRRGNRTQVI